MRNYDEEESLAVATHQPCPNCGSHDALTVYSDGHTYCFSCGKHSDTKTKKHTKTEGTKLSGALLTNLSEYPTLTKRKISQATCKKFHYYATERNGKKWHVANYYNKNRELVAQHLRGPEKQFIWKGKPDNLLMFGQLLWGDTGKRVIVTEGEIDCMSISQIQDNRWAVVSIPGGVGSAVESFKDNLEWLCGYELVVICFDMDKQGQKAAVEVAQLLPPGKAAIAQLPLKDASEMLQEGRTKELLSCLWNAQVYRPEGILDGTTLWQEIIKEPEKGYDTPYEQLNEKTQGIRHGELWLFTAGSGIGKSTIVHEIGYKLFMEYGLKLGVMALEESKRRTAERYLGIYLNTPLHISREGISEAMLKDAFDKTIGQEPCRFELYDHFGSTGIDTLIGKMRYMFVGLGVDVIILDHITITVSGLDATEISEGERRTLDVLMTKLRSLVEETGKTVIAVSHLKRPEQGKSWNEGREPRLTDLRGSASLEQLSDVVVALSRNQTDENKSDLANILILKNRPIGITGNAGCCQYIRETGRLLHTNAGAEYFGVQQTDATNLAGALDEDNEMDF